jgi:ElaB/YqjD/DUF883 family membrane-anchored ribosome-binding protein
VAQRCIGGFLAIVGLYAEERAGCARVLPVDTAQILITAAVAFYQKRETTTMSATDQAADENLAAQLRRLQGDFDALKQTMAGLGENLSKKAEGEAKSMLAEAEAFARDNPRTVLAGAVGLGLVLRLLLRRH